MDALHATLEEFAAEGYTHVVLIRSSAFGPEGRDMLIVFNLEHLEHRYEQRTPLIGGKSFEYETPLL